MRQQATFSRRAFITGAALSGATILIAACSPSAPSPTTAAPTSGAKAGAQSEAKPTSPAKAEAKPTAAAKAETKPSAGAVTIEFWVDPAEGKAEAMWQKAIDEFQQQNPNITPKVVVVPYEDAENKTLTSIAGNVPIDLVYVHPMWNATFAVKGVTVPLDSYIAKDMSQEELEDFYTGAIAYFKWDGQINALPVYSGPNTFYYNKDLLSQAGLEDPWALYQKGDWTITKYDEYIAKLSTGSGADRVFGTSGVSRSIRHQANWLWGFGGEVWSEDFKQTLIDTDKSVEGWDYIASLVTQHVAPTPAESQALPGGSLGGFNSGRIAIYYGIRQSVYQFKEDGNWGVVPMHKMPDGKEYTRDGPNALGLTKLSKHPDEAWTYLRFATTRGVELLMEARATAPTTKTLAKSEVWTKSLLPWEPAEVYDVAAKQVETKVLPHLPGMSEMDRLIQSAFDTIVLGETTAKQAMSEVKPKVDAVLKEKLGG